MSLELSAESPLHSLNLDTHSIVSDSVLSDLTSVSEGATGEELANALKSESPKSSSTKKKTHKKKSKVDIKKKKQEARSEELSQPKRQRSKRYRLERSDSKRGFGSGSSRDLFFGQVPAEGSSKQYLSHSELDQKSGAQSAFKSKSFLQNRVPFGPQADSVHVELQHGVLQPMAAPGSSTAPFGSKEGKFKIYDWYHYCNGNSELVAPGSYFQSDLQGHGLSSPRDSMDSDSGMHPHALAFQQKHKHFRSTNDLQLRKGPSLQKAKRNSKSTMNLPVHLVKRTKSSGSLMKDAARISAPTDSQDSQPRTSIEEQSRKESRSHLNDEQTQEQDARDSHNFQEPLSPILQHTDQSIPEVEL